MRDYIEGADVAIANFENPAPNAYRFHGSGTVFSANPAYIKGLAERGHRLGLARQQPHRRRRPRRDAPDDPERREVRHRALRARQEHEGGPQGRAAQGRRDDRRPARVRRDRRRLRTPARTRPGRRASRRRPSRPTSGPRARPAPTSSSSCPHWGIEYRSTPFPRSRRWPATRSTPAPTWSSATTPTGRARWRSRTASRSGTRSATSCSTRRGQPDDGGDHARADVQRHGPRPGADAAAPDPRRAQPNFLDPLGDGKRAVAGLPGVEGAARLVATRRLARRLNAAPSARTLHGIGRHVPVSARPRGGSTSWLPGSASSCSIASAVALLGAAPAALAAGPEHWVDSLNDPQIDIDESAWASDWCGFAGRRPGLGPHPWARVRSGWPERRRPHRLRDPGRLHERRDGRDGPAAGHRPGPLLREGRAPVRRGDRPVEHRHRGHRPRHLRPRDRRDRPPGRQRHRVVLRHVLRRDLLTPAGARRPRRGTTGPRS